MKEIHGLAYLRINGKDIIVLADDYNGSPILGYKPDLILASRITIKKYKKEFLPVLKDARIRYLD